jgi:hypothetical protein
MTPIRCVITFAQEIFDGLKKGREKNQANMIICTSKLLLAQVKMLLDRSLMENGYFTP